MLTFPSIASLAHVAWSSFEKMTNPKPLDLPLSLSYTILTTRKGPHWIRPYDHANNWIKQNLFVCWMNVNQWKGTGQIVWKIQVVVNVFPYFKTICEQELYGFLNAIARSVSLKFYWWFEIFYLITGATAQMIWNFRHIIAFATPKPVFVISNSFAYL